LPEHTKGSADHNRQDGREGSNQEQLHLMCALTPAPIALVVLYRQFWSSSASLGVFGGKQHSFTPDNPSSQTADISSNPVAHGATTAT
jgi:hypothetical protein